MRFRLPTCLGVLLLAASCGPPTQPLQAPAPARFLLQARPEEVLKTTASVLTRLGWDVTINSPAEGVVRAVSNAQGGGNRHWMRCPEGYTWWGPGLPRSTMAVRLDAALGLEGSNVTISARVVRAYAYDRYFRETTLITCVSSGEIERALADSLRVKYP
jgi:hypothetical protein